jgi:hypothetical protein
VVIPKSTQTLVSQSANFLCSTRMYLFTIRHFFSTFNRPTQNLLASGPKYQLFHRSFILRSYMYHLCSVGSPSHTNWAANVSITFPLLFPCGIAKNGWIATAVCPLFHGLEIITDTGGLEYQTEEHRYLQEREW